jgi:DNA mismatch endonuclease (patch repair protein)
MSSSKKNQRSALMSRIRGKNTSPELVLRKTLWKQGVRYRLNQKILGVRPDFVFLGEKVAIFVDGCFWHGCPEHYVRPRSSRDFWDKKLMANVIRDRNQTLELERQGWTVLRYWEHQVYLELETLLKEITEYVKTSANKTIPARWVVVKVETIDEEKDFERRFLENLINPDLKKTLERKRCTKKW